MGARVSLLELLRRLPKDRFQPIVACHKDGDLSEALRDAGIEVRRVLYRNYRKGKYLPLIPYSIFRLALMIRREGIRLVHSNEFWVNPYGIWACRFSSAWPICHFRTSRTPQELPAKKLKQYKVHNANRLILVSPIQEEHFRDIPELAGRIRIVPNGVDLNRFRQPVSSPELKRELGWLQHRLVGLLGSISPHKGHDHFIQAIPAILTRHPNVKFLIVGEPRPVDYIDHCQQLAASLAIGPDVLRFLPFYKDPVPVYQSLDILVCPSQKEAFGRVNIEAMACGVPVVAYPVGGIPFVLRGGRGGILVNDQTPAGLAAAISGLLQDPQRMTAMGQQGMAEVRERFDIEVHAQHIAAIYDEVLAEAQGIAATED